MIHKFRTIGTHIPFDFDIEFEKDRRVYCIIGENGIGKTQLLENMAKSLIYSHSIFLSSGNYKYKGFYSSKYISDKLKDLYIKLPLDITINDIKIKDKKEDSWTFTSFENIVLFRPKNIIFDKPVVFIGAKNRGYTKNINPENVKIVGSNTTRFTDSLARTMSYINGEGLEKEEVADWFLSRIIINPKFVKEDKIDEVIAVLKLIEKLEPKLKLVSKNSDGEIDLKISYYNGELLISDTPLDKLSTGFVSIIKIFQEIIAGYGGWSSDLNQVDGVVFIDEIDAHLHIKWQTKVINILKDFFPKTTFYISTHSPLVLSGLQTGEAYELYQEDNFVKAKKIEKIDNYFLNDFVKDFFGVDLNREKLDSVDKEKQEKAREFLLNLTNSFAGYEK